MSEELTIIYYEITKDPEKAFVEVERTLDRGESQAEKPELWPEEAAEKEIVS